MSILVIFSLCSLFSAFFGRFTKFSQNHPAHSSMSMTLPNKSNKSPFSRRFSEQTGINNSRSVNTLGHACSPNSQRSVDILSQTSGQTSGSGKLGRTPSIKRTRAPMPPRLVEENSSFSNYSSKQKRSQSAPKSPLATSHRATSQDTLLSEMNAALPASVFTGSVRTVSQMSVDMAMAPPSIDQFLERVKSATWWFCIKMAENG